MNQFARKPILVTERQNGLLLKTNQKTLMIKKRIESIDIIKGLVMVIMALDHVRDYFHSSAYIFSPTDPEKTTLILFFTRFITHFCAPTFSFLAGISAYIVGKRKTKNELSIYLIKRGIWLVFVELVVMNFGWFFDIHFRTITFGVIWSLGISMIFLAGLINLSRNYMLIFSLIVIAGHNLLDTIQFSGNIVWAMVHNFYVVKINENSMLAVGYPIIPWIAVMSLGYYFGDFYKKQDDVVKRKSTFNIIGFCSIGLFLILRFTNLYGDKIPYINHGSVSKNIISFLNPSKYPPSLLYLLMTLGVAFLLLANIEGRKYKIMSFFSTFGKVPLFYYILHAYVIHLLAIFISRLAGFNYGNILPALGPDFVPDYLKGYGYSLLVVYVVWIFVVLLIYPICLFYNRYKEAHKEKWWLSYL